MRIISSFTDLYDHASGWVDPTITFVRETQYDTLDDSEDRLVRTFQEFTRHKEETQVYFILGKVFHITKEGIFHADNLPPKKRKVASWWIFNSHQKYKQDYSWVNERFNAPIVGAIVPEWRWIYINIEINPMIKDTGIGKHYPPFNMQQDIMQWIINRQEPKGNYDFDDETVRNSKGFDSRSFKHRK